MQIGLNTLFSHAPHSIAYVGPSVTPLTNLNMGYKIYSVDGGYSNTTNVSSYNIPLCISL